MVQSKSTHEDQPLIGIALMIGFCMLIPFGDALIKMLGQSVSLMTVLLARFTLQALLLWPLVLSRKEGSASLRNLSSRTIKLLGIRTLMHGLGIAGMFFGLQYMPLADTVAIAFIFPILMLAVGYLFLKEHVGPHRIVASIVGFVGTLLVVQPNFAAVGIHALWPFFVALTFVVFVLVTRKMSKDIDPISIQAISGLMALPLLILLILAFNGPGYEAFDLSMPTSREWWLLIGSGVIGTYAHLLMTWSLKYAPSTTLAPMQYLEIPFATFIGWLIFSDLPNQLATLGIVITIGAGVYIILREQRVLKKQRQG